MFDQKVFIEQRGRDFVACDAPENIIDRNIVLLRARSRYRLDQKLERLACNADLDGIRLVVVDRTR
jgi:hypothetical protein